MRKPLNYSQHYRRSKVESTDSLRELKFDSFQKINLGAIQGPARTFRTIYLPGGPRTYAVGI